MDPSPPPESSERESDLSRDLTEFLVQLSVGVRRFAIYPPGHPSLEPAVTNIMRRMVPFFLERRVLQIGVARDQLVIEGLATDSRHPVLRELGRRLHDQQLGAIAFSVGVSSAEVEDFLKTLAPELEGDQTPLGLLPAPERPSWEHIAIYPVGYDQLRLQEGASDRVTELWLGLAQAAMAGEALEMSEVPDARALAETIQTHAPETAYDQAIVGYMLSLADELKHGAAEGHPVRQSVSELVAELDEPTLSRLLKMGGHAAQRRRFVLDASQSLAGDSVVKVLKAAATASEQTISTSLTRLLSKLAMHAEYGPGEVPAQANTALRQNVEELISDWEQKDPNPQSYTRILDSMAHTAPILEAPGDGDHGNITGSERIVQMSLELDVFGPTVEKAVDDLIDGGEVAWLLEMIEGAEETLEAPERIRAQVMSPSTLWKLLEAGRIDDKSLGLVIRGMGNAAIGPLLDVLVESESRSLRRRIFDYLVMIGPEAGRGAAARLEDSRWFVARNVLALQNRVGVVPEGLDLLAFVAHDDPRVRREALSLALNHQPVRERALASGLTDEDERLVRMSLIAAQEGLPEGLAPTVIHRIVQADHPPDLRALGVRALRHSRSRLVPETLMELVVARRTIFGRPKIAPPEADVLAALTVLRDHWHDYPKVGPILKAARASKDALVRAAAQGSGEAR